MISSKLRDSLLDNLDVTKQIGKYIENQAVCLLEDVHTGNGEGLEHRVRWILKLTEHHERHMGMMNRYITENYGDGRTMRGEIQ